MTRLFENILVPEPVLLGSPTTLCWAWSVLGMDDLCEVFKWLDW